MFLLISLLIVLAVVAYIYTPQTKGAFVYVGSLIASTARLARGARYRVQAQSLETPDAIADTVLALDDALVDSKAYRVSSTKYNVESRSILAKARAEAKANATK